MKRYYRPIRHLEQTRPQASGTGWVVLWETRQIADEGRWSSASAGTEEDALERAAHFLKLGFFVHAIKDPLGAVFLDAEQIATRFGAAQTPPEAVRP